MEGEAGRVDFCRHCGHVVHGVHPRLSSRMAFWGMLALTAVVLLVSTAAGWGLFFALPVIGGMGMGLGPLATAAFAPRTCPDCGRLVLPARDAQRTA